MKKLILLFLLLAGVTAFAQQGAPPQREIYRIHFFKAAPGRLPDLLDAYLSLPAPPTGHGPLIFRHQSGDDWDLLVIYSQGAQAHIDASPNYTEAQRKLRERVMSDYSWHTDTYASGPPLAEVEKALALPKDSKSVFLVTDYTALNGHVQQLENELTRDTALAKASAAVRFDHVQGAPWDFLVMLRYGSWQDYATAQDAGVASQNRDSHAAGTSFLLREHMSAHHDTLVTRIQ